MANGEGIAVAAAGGIGCAWLLGILLTIGFWGLVIAALMKYVFGVEVF